jgi:hypothetical protein
METMATMGTIPWFQLAGCCTNASFLLELAGDNFRLTIDYEITNITLDNAHAIASPILNIFCRLEFLI